MCCCLGKKKCMCWFILAVLLAVIVLGCCIAAIVEFGGPVPTYRMEYGTVVIFFANSCTLIFSICAILFTMCGIKNIFVYVLLMILLIGTNGCSWFTVFAFHDIEPSVDQIRVYTTDYARANKGASPPFLDYVQTHVPICCGAENFDDYVITKPQNVNDTFDVPDSCCFRRGPKVPIRKDCGKGLTIENYNDLIWFHDQIANAVDAVQKAKTFGEANEILKQHFKHEITNIKTKITNSLNEAKSKNDTGAVLDMSFLDSAGYVPSFLRNALSTTVDTVPQDGLFGALESQLQQEQFEMEIMLPINFYGCARIVQKLGDAELVPRNIRRSFRSLFTAILVFVIVQAVINLIGLAYFNVYYWKKDDPAQVAQVPHQTQSVHNPVPAQSADEPHQTQSAPY